jgi:hypothetical protein
MVCLLIFPIGPILGWLVLFLPLHREPAMIFGSENDARGNAIRQIVFRPSYRTIGWLPDPEGGHDVKIKYRQFTLKESGKPNKELSFLSEALPDTAGIANSCEAVANSSAWVLAGYFTPGPTIDVYVFNETRMLSHRQINVTPDWNNAGHDFWFEKGNRLLRYKTNGGVGSYDVVADTIGPVSP